MPDAPITQPKSKEEIALARLEDQADWYADWYSKKSQSAQKKYKWIKITEIIAAALIPFFSPLKFPYVSLLVAGLGVLITIFEGILQLSQFQRIWTVYRATCEALTHEKFLYLARGGSYSDPKIDPAVLLAVRIETIMSQENAQWLLLQQKDKPQGDKN